MDTTVNIHEAKTQFSRLVERARLGERITIARAGVPVAVLTAIEPETRPRRPVGLDRGKVVIHDNFDDPLPEFDIDAWDVLDAPGHPPR
ncbi:MAG: type II toxin-antitoxin system Phd/YefM family antitoxin [Candidatus Limnocylindrales bacterium]